VKYESGTKKKRERARIYVMCAGVSGENENYFHMKEFHPEKSEAGERERSREDMKNVLIERDLFILTRASRVVNYTTHTTTSHFYCFINPDVHNARELCAILIILQIEIKCRRSVSEGRKGRRGEGILLRSLIDFRLRFHMRKFPTGSCLDD
jgi:hypothetical protein